MSNSTINGVSSIAPDTERRLNAEKNNSIPINNEILSSLRNQTNEFGFNIYRCAASSIIYEYTIFKYIAKIDSSSHAVSIYGTTFYSPLSGIAALVNFGTCAVFEDMKASVINSEQDPNDILWEIVALSSLQNAVKYTVRTIAINKFISAPLDYGILACKAVKGAINGFLYSAPTAFGVPALGPTLAPLIEGLDGVLDTPINYLKPKVGFDSKDIIKTGFYAGVAVNVLVHTIGKIVIDKGFYQKLIDNLYNYLDLTSYEVVKLLTGDIEKSTGQAIDVENPVNLSGNTDDRVETEEL